MFGRIYQTIRDRHVFCVLFLCVLISNLSSTLSKVYIHHFAVHTEGGEVAANRVARSTGFVNKGQIGSLTDHYLFEIPHRERRSASPSHEHHSLLSKHPEVKWFEQQISQKRIKRDLQQSDEMYFKDPAYKDQWYLHKGAYGGYDMNVIKAWKRGYTGKKVVISILDDGIERTHQDLQENYDPYASYDVNGADHDPMPRYDPTNENRHGTRCAGEVSAAANNSKCGIGIAYNSRIGGVRMLDGDVYDTVEATSLSFNRSHIDIYSASWGPDDDGRVVDGPGPMARKAFSEGIKYGRRGKGSIYVWASGNGGSAQDSCNCDGYTNSIYTLSISSTSEKGTKPWYLEECSSTLATTYSSGAYNEKQIVTDDLHDGCTSSHTGTSASAPLAAGIVALVLEANPNLNWRDVQYITLMSATPSPMSDGQWVVNGLGRKVSLRYGYGLMDANKMVDLAVQWTSIPEQHICETSSDVKNVRLTGQKYRTEIKTSGCDGSNKVKFLEHVQAKISLSYHRRGDVIIYLTSPAGTRSQLLTHRPNDAQHGEFKNWAFLSVHFWGEQPEGTWILEIEDANGHGATSSGGMNMGMPFAYAQPFGYDIVNSPSQHPGFLHGLLTSWSLVLYGTAEQPVRLQTTGTTPRPTVTTQPQSTGSVNVTVETTPSKIHCHEECEGKCSGPKPEDCAACKHFRIGINGACVSHCWDGYYTGQRVCQPCHKFCKTCFGPGQGECLSCPSGYLYWEIKQTCIDHCHEGYYKAESTCSPCQRECKGCVGLSNNCTSCPVGKVLSGTTCIYKGKVASSVWLPQTMRSVILILVVICLFLLGLLLLACGVLYARNNQLLCWSYKYNKLPCSDKDSTLNLTKNDFYDEDELS